MAALHEFLAANQVRILSLAIRNMKARWPDRDEDQLLDGLPAVLDEVIAAVRRHAGFPATSPLPGHSPNAERVGAERQRGHFHVSTIALTLGVISDCVGEIAAEEGLSFPAGEYHMFNVAIDTAAATALERYWAESQASDDERTAVQVGFMLHEVRNALAGGLLAFDVLRRGVLGINSRTGEMLGLRRAHNLIIQGLASVHLRGGVQVSTPRSASGLSCSTFRPPWSGVRRRGLRRVRRALQVEADERLLTAALTNLIQNAVKFTRPRGQVVVRARASEGSTLIEVEDECGGLAPGVEARMFRAFEQAGVDRRGFGLGLPIARQAVEAHHGSLTVRNLPGKGCVFVVRVPEQVHSDLRDAA